VALSDKQLCASKFDVVANILPTVFCSVLIVTKVILWKILGLGQLMRLESEIQGSVFV
jgi:hypothetical protein